MRNYSAWHLHHLSRRAINFGLDEIASSLDNLGWELTKKGFISAQDSEKLKYNIERLSKIKYFAKSCDKKDCPICFSVEKKIMEIKKSYTLDLELYRWQKEAKKEWWNNNGKGIIKVVTGAGKTLLALSIIEELKKKESYKDNLKVIIVVPTTALLDQWFDVLTSNLSVPEDKIALFCGRTKEEVKDKDIIIYVVNSAREHLQKHIGLFGNSALFLISDECHRYASKENSKIFQNKYEYCLGLSATPERKADYGFEEILIPNLGEIIYVYSYAQALKDKVMPPYYLKKISVPLSEEEMEKYESYKSMISAMIRKLKNKYPKLNRTQGALLYKELGAIFSKTQDPLISKLTITLNLRKNIIHKSKSKLSTLKWIFEKEIPKQFRILIFHERIEIAEQIFDFLKQNEFKVGIYHSDMKLKERLRNLREYRNGEIDILVTCKALDEGLDVPDTSVGIIVAATTSVRQWIQRMGRILRRSPRKDFSQIFVIYVKDMESEIFNEKEMKEIQTHAYKLEEIHMN